MVHSGSLCVVGPELPGLVSNQLTNSCLIDLMDMILDDEEACSKEVFWHFSNCYCRDLRDFIVRID